MLIIDMVLCALRALFVLFSAASYQVLPADNPLATTVLWEIAAGAGIVVFGLSGDLLLLLKKPWAMGLAWLSVLSTLGATAVGVWALSLLAEPMAGNDQAKQIGFWVGGGITLLVRLGILVVFVAALVVYSKWARQLPRDN